MWAWAPHRINGFDYEGGINTQLETSPLNQQSLAWIPWIIFDNNDRDLLIEYKDKSIFLCLNWHESRPRILSKVFFFLSEKWFSRYPSQTHKKESNIISILNLILGRIEILILEMRLPKIPFAHWVPKPYLSNHLWCLKF